MSRMGSFVVTVAGYEHWIVKRENAFVEVKKINLYLSPSTEHVTCLEFFGDLNDLEFVGFCCPTT